MQSYGHPHAHQKDREERSLVQSMLRSLRGRCPTCGEGRLFRGFIKPVDACGHCGEEMHHQRADDLPPYLAIFIVGHIVVGGYMFGERLLDLNIWQHMVIWVPITLVMTLLIMQPLKGAVIGLQWALGMHGFGGEKDMPAGEFDDDKHP